MNTAKIIAVTQPLITKEQLIESMTKAMMEQIPPNNVDAADIFNAAIVAFEVCLPYLDIE